MVKVFSSTDQYLLMFLLLVKIKKLPIVIMFGSILGSAFNKMVGTMRFELTTSTTPR